MELLKVIFVDTHDIDTDSLLQSSLLKEEDKEKINNVTHQETRKEKIVSSYLLRKYIGSYEINEFGKPISDSAYFNVSHSKGFVAFVMSNIPTGIDIELIRDYKEELKQYISNEEEKQYINNNVNFFEVWTNKESLTKCLGTGIRSQIKEIPALPINGLKEYKNKTFRSNTIIYRNCVITVTRESKKNFKIVVEEGE